jgi:hypothetical protein
MRMRVALGSVPGNSLVVLSQTMKRDAIRGSAFRSAIPKTDAPGEAVYRCHSVAALIFFPRFLPKNRMSSPKTT